LKQIRRHFTYANVMSSLAVFLILGGATAIAANKIGANRLKANSVKTGKIVKEAVTASKLKKAAVTEAKIADGAVTNGKLADNAVTTPKIADNAVTNPKIADNAVTGSKIADGSVSGADINIGSAPFSQVVAEIRGTAQLPATTGLVYPLNNPTYTQQAGEDNQYIGAADVTFQPSCTAPRSATVFLLVDAANPTVPTANDLAGFGSVSDAVGGTVSRRAEFVPFVGGAGMTKFAPTANTQHTFSVFVAAANCSAATSGITITGAGVDVIGTK
jgi:hypothetical protein